MFFSWLYEILFKPSAGKEETLVLGQGNIARMWIYIMQTLV